MSRVTASGRSATDWEGQIHDTTAIVSTASVPRRTSFARKLRTQPARTKRTSRCSRGRSPVRPRGVPTQGHGAGPPVKGQRIGVARRGAFRRRAARHHPFPDSRAGSRRSASSARTRTGALETGRVRGPRLGLAALHGAVAVRGLLSLSALVLSGGAEGVWLWLFEAGTLRRVYGGSWVSFQGLHLRSAEVHDWPCKDWHMSHAQSEYTESCMTWSAA